MQLRFIPGVEGGTPKSTSPFPFTMGINCWLALATCDEAVEFARNCCSEGSRVDPGSGGGSWEQVHIIGKTQIHAILIWVSFRVLNMGRTVEAGTVYLWGLLFHSKRAFRPCWCISVRSSPSYSVSERPFSRHQDPRTKSLDCLKIHGDVSV